MAVVIKLNTIEQWEKLKKDIIPPDELLIFKFSPVCPISSRVEDYLNTWLSELPEDYKLKCAKVDVIEAKEVSLKIAADLNIEHESPQAIWLTGDLKVKWYGSHYDINKNKLKANLNKA
jgi:bacillithiol system protein YtxJ